MKKKIVVIFLLFILFLSIVGFKVHMQPDYNYVYWDSVELKYTEGWRIENYSEVKEQKVGSGEVTTAGGRIVNEDSISIIISLMRGEFPPSNAFGIGWYEIPGFDDKDVLIDKTSVLEEYGIIDHNEMFICLKSLSTQNKCIFLTPSTDSEYYVPLEKEDRLFVKKFAVGRFDSSTIQIDIPKDLDVTNYMFEEELDLINDFLQMNN